MTMNFKLELPLDNIGFVKVTNPFKKTRTESGLFIPDSPTAYSNETGQEEPLELAIGFGIVTVIGPDCKSVEEGDGVYFNVHTPRPLPFQDGLLTLNERQVMGIIKGNGTDLLQVVKDFTEKEESIARESSKQREERERKANFARQLGVVPGIIS